MSDIHVRPATASDARDMAALLNEIIEIGGTTAYLEPVSTDDMVQKMARGGARASWLVATQDNRVVGFQWAEPHDQLPPEAASIASFVDVDIVGKGIGSKLFSATRIAARALGFEWLNASIRSDNDSGLSYYAKMGFHDWKIEPVAALSDGTITGKHHKRFDL